MDAPDEEEKRKQARSPEEIARTPERSPLDPPRPVDPNYRDPAELRDERGTMRRDNEKLVAENMRAQEDERRQQHDTEVDTMAKEHARMLGQQADDLRDLQSRTDALGQEIEKKYDGFEKDGGKFAHEKQRHKDARAEQNDPDDPYATLQRAASTEYAKFAKEQQDYEERIANEHDLTKRTELTMQKDIRAADHLAFTSHRIADQGELIAGFKDNDVSEQFRERASEQEDIAKDTRDRYKLRGMNAKWEENERKDYEASLESAQRSREAETKYAANPISAEWSDSSAELTDSQLDRLAKLEERYAETSKEVTEHHEGPARPMSDSGGMSR